MQIKKVLEYEFSEVLQSIANGNPFARYQVHLPMMDDVRRVSIPGLTATSSLSLHRSRSPKLSNVPSYSSCAKTSPKGIPMCQIAKQLQLQLQSASLDYDDDSNDGDDNSEYIDDTKGNIDNNHKTNKNDFVRKLSLSLYSGVNSVSNPIPIITRKSIDIISIKQGNDMIDCFGELYRKYISNSSEFTINIQSKTRKILQSMFDKTYYQSYLRSSNTNSPTINQSNSHATAPNKSHIDRKKNKVSKSRDKSGKQNSNSISRKIVVKISNLSKLSRTGTPAPAPASAASPPSPSSSSTPTPVPATSKGNPNGIDKVPYLSESRIQQACSKSGMNLIKQEFGKATQVCSNENQLFVWLLTELIVNMESAVREISALMNDSFSRFQKDKQLHEKCIELALKNRKEYNYKENTEMSRDHSIGNGGARRLSLDTFTSSTRKASTLKMPSI